MFQQQWYWNNQYQHRLTGTWLWLLSSAFQNFLKYKSIPKVYTHSPATAIMQKWKALTLAPRTPPASRHFDLSSLWWFSILLLHSILQRWAKNNSSLQLCEQKPVRWIITSPPWRKTAPSISSKYRHSFQKAYFLHTARTLYSLWILWSSLLGLEMYWLEMEMQLRAASPVDDYITVQQ